MMLKRDWLACKDTHYHLGAHLVLPCIGGDWVLVAARVFPFVIVALFDTALFYQVRAWVWRGRGGGGGLGVPVANANALVAAVAGWARCLQPDVRFGMHTTLLPRAASPKRWCALVAQGAGVVGAGEGGELWQEEASGMCTLVAGSSPHCKQAAEGGQMLCTGMTWVGTCACLRG